MNFAVFASGRGSNLNAIIDAVETPQQRGLAATGGPDEGGDLATGNNQRQLIECRPTGIGKAQLTHLHGRSGGVGGSLAGQWMGGQFRIPCREAASSSIRSTQESRLCDNFVTCLQSATRSRPFTGRSGLFPGG